MIDKLLVGVYNIELCAVDIVQQSAVTPCLPTIPAVVQKAPNLKDDVYLFLLCMMHSAVHTSNSVIMHSTVHMTSATDCISLSAGIEKMG